ncbi:MAG: hypothetical protein WAO91_04405 [Candidatus Nitrosotenuis sp.]
MVIVWIAIGLGVLAAYILIRKILKASPKAPLKISLYCKKCGYKTNGLKCPRCENTQNRQSWK